jgi:hypothetical protein
VRDPVAEQLLAADLGQAEAEAEGGRGASAALKEEEADREASAAPKEEEADREASAAGKVAEVGHSRERISPSPTAR